MEISHIKNVERIKQYEDYITEHRRNVRIAADALMNMSKFKELTKQFSLIDVMNHDISKVQVEEFDGYRQNFFPFEGEVPDKEIFNKAWEHHYQVNDHHWEYWAISNPNDDGTPARMSDNALFHMLVDWLAMSMKFKNKPSKWYNQNKNRMQLHELTRSTVEMMLSYVDDAYEKLTFEG